ncbi:MAG: imidazole glycerol phosphate synthase subunit HisF, partial [Candidatus Peribacteraceae bacterium]|nr:imidazole glycerol phosphate synthase subunit HisF [Candidatus Peribacteraceae bacterium]
GKNYPDIAVIASGGVRNAKDIRGLAAAGCTSAVVGKSLISKQVSLAELLRGKSDLAIRIIPCLDIAEGRTVKGTKFQNLRDAGDPVELAARYCKEGADELVFLDISASTEDRETVFDLAARVAEAVNIPFTIGGGIRSVEDARRLLEAGADKVSINSAAVARPELLSEIAQQLGRANTVCAIDAMRKGKSWVVLTKGGTEETEKDAIEWAVEAEQRGAGELLVTSFDRDGTGEGFDTELLARIKECVKVPVIASGGAGTLRDFVEAVTIGKADALLAASVFHFQTFSISDVKRALSNASFPVRS